MSTSIQDILDVIKTSGILLEHTVDKLDYGNPDSAVKGIATAFLATQEIIENARELGVNLIISHEGIFYSHRGNTEVLLADKVYKQKCRTILESDMAIFRYHDYIHRFTPDGITAGLLQALSWRGYEVENLPTSSVVELPSTTVQFVINHVKSCLGIESVRFIGDLTMTCKRIGVLVGYRGGSELALPLFAAKDLDMIIYGEGPEWETPEYVRDALQQGKRKSLLVIGHAESEMPGMKYLAQYLQKKFPDIPVHFIPQGPVFKIC